MLGSSTLFITLAMGFAACGAPSEPPPAAQLIDDVREAMETAPSFRFEGEHAMSNPIDGTRDMSVMRVTGEVSGESILWVSEVAAEAITGGMAIVGGEVYRSDQGHWQRFPMFDETMGAAPRRTLVPPDGLINAMVRKETLDGVSVWVLTAERPLEGFEGTDLSTSIEPLQTHRWVVDPETSRALRWESSSDFGTVTYPDADIDLGPQRIAFAWTFYDYDVDIVIRAPLVGGGAPPPTPLPTHTPTP